MIIYHVDEWIVSDDVSTFQDKYFTRRAKAVEYILSEFPNAKESEDGFSFFVNEEFTLCITKIAVVE